MLPKKKIVTDPVTIENPAPPILTSEQKIPKKPLLRTVRLCSLNKIYHLQIKLWRLKSCRLAIVQTGKNDVEDRQNRSTHLPRLIIK